MTREELVANLEQRGVDPRLWTTDQLQEDFDVIGFQAPFVVVVRKSDGVEGSMQFQHSPRFYFDFKSV